MSLVSLLLLSVHSKLKQRKKYSFDHKIAKLEGSDQTIYLVIIEFPLNKTELNSLLNKKSLGAESFSLTGIWFFLCHSKNNRYLQINSYMYKGINLKFNHSNQLNHIKFKQLSLSILLKQIHSDSFSSQPYMYVSRILIIFTKRKFNFVKTTSNSNFPWGFAMTFPVTMYS